MKHVLSALPAFLRVAIANMIQYRAEIALWAAWGVVSPAVMMALWNAAAHASSDPGRIGHRSAGEISAYFFMTMIVGHITAAWDVYEMGWLVRSGRLSASLLRPILPVWASLADNIAYKLVTLVILVPIWALIAWAVRPTFHTSAHDACLALAALPLASGLSFVWGYVVGTLAFFVTKMDAASELFFGASMFFGGRIAPIDLLPAPLQWVAQATPFQWIFAYPCELLAGQLDPSRAMRGLVWQVAWLIAGIVAFRVMWSRGVRRYSAVGA